VAVSMVMPPFAAPGLEIGAAAMTWLAPFLRPLVELMPEGPPPALRAMARYRILAEALGAGRRAAVMCEGADPYGMTAVFLVEAADRLHGTGAMAPAQALDPEPFLDAVSRDGFRWRRLA
jgi:hypothetical protein